MSLCSEKQIANKAETCATMIFTIKAFESMFDGVSCLPGCFSMYRIEAPKSDTRLGSYSRES